ncbi:MAG: bifunctional glutamate N-acetyltransferase/amino-acid acetyltransferase ArgJ [Gammaproteobacteria bacterium]
MDELRTLPGGLYRIPGVRLASTCAGIQRHDRDDLVLIEIAAGGQCAAVFTRNAFCAAPVAIARRHLLGRTPPRYLLVNSGNANAAMGELGLEDALSSCRRTGVTMGCAPEEVLPFSTGVIGERLPVERIERALPVLRTTLSDSGWEAAARAIMTTDTVPKACSIAVQAAGQTVHVTGIAKGAGMIHPDMATLLAFVATDATIAAPLLQRCLGDAVTRSFNRISVDGDTSTNDACVLIATGQSAAPAITAPESPGHAEVGEAIAAVCIHLAQAIVRDGEGATKFVSIEVSGGRSEAECLRVARTVACSPLVKTALFASDPNWGRIAAAVGRAPIPDLEARTVSIAINDCTVLERGARAAGYTDQQGRDALAGREVAIRIALGRGESGSTFWTCDLSHDYVNINADYRS